MPSATTPEIETETVVAFREGARIPAGVTAEGLAAEIDSISEEFGQGTASAHQIKEAIETNPDSYPNLIAWLPRDREQAWDMAVTARIREAVRSIIRYSIVTEGDTSKETPAIRVYHVVTNHETGEKGYKRLDMIVKSRVQVLELYDSLREDMQRYLKREQQVGDEIRALLKAMTDQES